MLNMQSGYLPGPVDCIKQEPVTRVSQVEEDIKPVLHVDVPEGGDVISVMVWKPDPLALPFNSCIKKEPDDDNKYCIKKEAISVMVWKPDALALPVNSCIKKEPDVDNKSCIKKEALKKFSQEQKRCDDASSFPIVIKTEFDMEEESGSQYDDDEHFHIHASVTCENLRSGHSMQGELSNDQCTPNVLLQEQYLIPRHRRCAKPRVRKPTFDICDICHKSFEYRTNYMRHLRMHRGERPYSCDECGKHFREQKTLSNHTLTHTGKKTFLCDVCPKLFGTISLLKIHMRTHTGEMPYKCETCHRSFRQVTHFSRHMRSHSSVKSYTCGECNKSFSHKHDLRTHVQRHVGVELFACDWCYKPFTRKAHVVRHTQLHLDGIL